MNIVYAVDHIKLNRLLPHPVRNILSLCVNVIIVFALVDLEKLVSQTLCQVQIQINEYTQRH